MSQGDLISVAVVGASGYVGGELLRLLAIHPRVRLATVTSEKSAGKPVSEVFPHLAALVPGTFEPLDAEAVSVRADLIFLALPHTKSFQPASVCLEAGKKVVDLSADFRLRDPAAYKDWYDTTHPRPDLLHTAVYGLPELHREDIRSAQLVASPGCYPTAAILQLSPLAAKGLIQPGSIIIDAKSGVSGAGRSPALPYHFPEANESIEAYNIGRHRHTPEIEQELSILVSGHEKSPFSQGGHSQNVTVAFTPHLVPMNRGILSTAYCRLSTSLSPADIRSLYHEFYKGENFVRLLGEGHSANPRYMRGSNFCDLSLHVDARSGLVVTTAALDNLVKGAAGQAIQAMNLMLGFPESLGLLTPGVYP